MRLLTGSKFLLAAALIHLPHLLAAPAPGSSDLVERLHDAGINHSQLNYAQKRKGSVTTTGKDGKDTTTDKSSKTTTIAGVEIKLNDDDVPILGTALGVGGKPKPMSVYEAAGKKSYTDYIDAVSHKTDDTTTTTERDKIVKNKVFPDAFQIKDSVYQLADSKEELYTDYPELKYFSAPDLGGFDVSKKLGGQRLTHKTITNKPPASQQNSGMPTILEGVYDKSGLVQVALNAFKGNDNTAKTSDYRLPVNELSWQTWTSVANSKQGNNLKNLQIIFLVNIQNTGFWQIAAENYKEAGIAPNKVAVWEPKDAKHTVWFERFLGSDNINGKMIALKNHHTEIGDKKIARVVTMPRQAIAALGAPGPTSMKFTAALVLASS